MSVIINEKEYLTSKEVCQLYSMSNQLLQYWRKKGLKYYNKSLKKNYYLKSDIDEFLIGKIWKDPLEKQIIRDKQIKEFCEQYDIKLIVIKYDMKQEEIQKILNDLWFSTIITFSTFIEIRLSKISHYKFHSAYLIIS